MWYSLNASGNSSRVNDVIWAFQMKMSLFFFIIFQSSIHRGKEYFYKNWCIFIKYWEYYRSYWKLSKHAMLDQVLMINQHEDFNRLLSKACEEHLPRWHHTPATVIQLPGVSWRFGQSNRFHSITISWLRDIWYCDGVFK